MFSYIMRTLMHPIHLVLSFATLSNELFCGSFVVQNHVFFVRAQQQNKCNSSTTETKKLQEATTMF